MALKGLKRVRGNFKSEMQRNIPARAQKAAYVATSIIAGHAALMTPVDTSNLINSQFTRVIKVGTAAVGVIGYTANYAIYVHEAKGSMKGQPRPNGRGDYWAPNGKPQFLLKAVIDNRSEIDRAVYKAMKV